MKQTKVNIGDVCVLKISALGPNGIGIDEYSYPFSIFVPNTKLNDIVKAKIIRVNLKGTGNYAIAKVLKVKPTDTTKKSVVERLKLEPNQLLTVNIKKVTATGAGLVNLKFGYKLIIPQAVVSNGTSMSGGIRQLGNTEELRQVQVVITRVKSKYAFAKIVNSPVSAGRGLSQVNGLSLSSPKLVEGSKYTLNIPKTAKKYGNYVFIKVQGSLVFLKIDLNAKAGDKVRIKITKVKNKYAIAKIIQINPLSLIKKRILIRNNIRQMIQNGMHLGEKAVKCNARMKNYIWFKKQGVVDGRSPEALALLARSASTTVDVASSLTKVPLIKKGNHIINLLKTRRCLNKALTQLTKYALKGSTFLFIGTKKAAAGLIARASLFSKNSFFVNTRWLGGLLTNWKTIRRSISKIRPILQEKQKIVADILEKRKRIKMRLIKKGLFIKSKTQLILKKGRSLLAKIKNPEYKALILDKTKKLALKQKELIENCQTLVSKHKVLELKRRKVMYQNIVLKQHIANTIINRYNSLLRQLTIYTQKLRQLKNLLILSNELKKIKNKAHEQNTKVLNIDNKKIKTLLKTTGTSASLNLLPQPPKDILNLILLTVKSNSKAFTGAFKDSAFLNIETKTSATNKALLVSDFVSSLSGFVPALQELIKTYENNINLIKTSLTQYSTSLNTIKISLRQDIEFHQLLVNELKTIKDKLNSQRQVIRIVRAKLTHFARQKRVIRFLPRLRHFKIWENASRFAGASFKTKIISIVQILMKKIVDPKLKYPVDNIYDSKLGHYSKKIASARKKKWQRFEKYFGGIAKMTEMTKSQISKNVAIIVGQKEEINAIRECKKVGIKMFNIVDTNCNPTLADHIIPANDDSRNSIKFVLNKFLVRIRLAQKLRRKTQLKQNKTIAYKKLKNMANQIRQNLNTNGGSKGRSPRKNSAIK
uniref:Small ribosomal subunit protein uS2c n=1 Tax=Chlamydomonas moewusii TaxID=3054 RepID=B2X2C3_CHLMO|nr:ribosomal protein S2 [Chlamydomonas moewusii]